jgi:lipoprotein NlpD
VSVLMCLLAGCSTHRAIPPQVVEGWHGTVGQDSGYRVQPGDTLYSIAWAYGLDYHSLAKNNHLASPYVIQPGGVLSLRDAPKEDHSVARRPARRPVTTKTKQTTKKRTVFVHQKGGIHWQWPAQGKVLHGFSMHATRRGIDIGAKAGAPVKSAAKGVVVYSGSGLRGYGRLVIVKHSASYLSAYAYNKHLLVKEGQHVKAGQVIANMGSIKVGGPGVLHFQIRYHGKPVNPLRYLQA